MKRVPRKTQIMAIVHGQSEFCICSNIKSNLRLKHEIFAKDKGRLSIQINGLLDILQNKVFININNFSKQYPDIEIKKKALVNFKLFIIMDTDDCNEEVKNKFKDKSLFKGHWLFPYIVPIFNDPNLEATMEYAEIPINKKRDYITIFPTNHGDLDMSKAEDLRDKLCSCNCTNLNEYLTYCIDLCNSFRVHNNT